MKPAHRSHRSRRLMAAAKDGTLSLAEVQALQTKGVLPETTGEGSSREGSRVLTLRGAPPVRHGRTVRMDLRGVLRPGLGRRGQRRVACRIAR